jgi:hypothetical protein
LLSGPSADPALVETEASVALFRMGIVRLLIVQTLSD